MEREVEQNELPIVNKNTRKKQKKLSKMAKMRQNNPMDLCGENRKIKKNSQKKQKHPARRALMDNGIIKI